METFLYLCLQALNALLLLWAIHLMLIIRTQNEKIIHDNMNIRHALGMLSQALNDFR